MIPWRPISRDPEPRRGFHAADRGRIFDSAGAKVSLEMIANRLKMAGNQDQFGEPQTRVGPLCCPKIEDSPMSSHWKRIIFGKMLLCCLAIENLIVGWLVMEILPLSQQSCSVGHKSSLRSICDFLDVT